MDDDLKNDFDNEEVDLKQNDEVDLELNEEVIEVKQDQDEVVQ